MIRYKRGYKYQLASDYWLETPIWGTNGRTDWITLTTHGELTIRKGYAWDGASGPAIDTRTFMRASLVHDALYELMRYGVLDRSRKGDVDRLMREICLEDGMSRARAWWVFRGVGWFGGRATRRRREVLTAP